MGGEKLFLLGSPYLEQNGVIIQIRRRKALALLAYLAVTRQGHSRSVLASLLWPEMDENRSRTTLRRVLSDLNKALGNSWSQMEDDRVALHPDADFWVDIEEFHAHLASCRDHGHGPNEVCLACLTPLRAAVNLYRDDFLAGFTLPDSPAFDEWQFFETENQRQGVVSALARLVDGFRRFGDPNSAITYARRLLAFEPWHEATHRALMELYHESGRHSAALRQYNEARRILAVDLGALPSAETTLLYESINARRVSLAPRVETGRSRRVLDNDSTAGGSSLGEPVHTLPADPSRIRHNLPTQVTPFVGREIELSSLQELFNQGATRLVTIVAPGGMGKTRLAIEIAHRNLHDFPDGVWFVELAPIQAPEHIATAIIDTLALEFHGSTDVWQQLLRYLQDKTMMLLLDSYEHLLPAASLVTEILQAAPGLSVIITSQQRLSLNAETVCPIGGLALAAGEGKDETPTSEAIELFTRTARRLRPGLEWSSDDVQQVAWICQAVEGMPLAIVLAASWIEVLSLPEIAAEIVRSLDFLSAELADLPRRHWSIRAVFETTWQRLNAREQAIFMKLSIFRGGFTRDAAQAVAGANLLVLKSLVGRYLVNRNSEGRYLIHELLRKYALEQLERGGRYAAAIRRHAKYYLALAQEGNLALTGPDQEIWLNRLEAEHYNFRSVLDWSLSGADMEMGAHLAGALASYWLRRAHYLEATSVGERALSLLGDKPAQARLALHLMLGSIYEPLAQYEVSTRHYEAGLQIARAEHVLLGLAFALHGLSRVAWRQGRYAVAGEYAACSLQAAETAGDSHSIARALHQLGLVTSHQGEHRRAHDCYIRSLTLSQALGNQRGMANTLVELGWIASSQGDYARAHGYLTRSLAISEALGSRMDIAASFNTLGWTAEAQGDDAGARDHYGRALVIYESTGVRTGLANTLANLIFVLLRQGDVNAAHQNLHKALSMAHENGDLPVALEILIGYAWFYFETDHVQDSVQLAALVFHHSALNSQVRKSRLDPLLAKLEQTLLPDCLAAALVEGESLELDTAIQELLAGASGPTRAT